MTRMNNKHSFLEGSVFRSLISFTIPVIMALALQALYGAADLWAVGRFGTQMDVSGVTTGSQTMTIITAFVTGLSTAVTVVIGQRIGENRKDKCADALSSAIYIIFISCIVLSLALIFGADFLAKFMNAPKEAFKETTAYLRICGAGVIFIGAYNLIAGTYRSIGDAKSPLLFVLYAAIANVAMDIVLTGFLKMGSSGAAFATIGAQAFSVVLSLLYSKKHPIPFTFGLEDLKKRDSMAEIIQVGLPLSIQNVLGVFSFMIVISMTNRLGVTASAGVGVSEKIVMFVLMVPQAFMAAMSAFTAQNYGAGNVARQKEGLKVGLITSSVLGFTLFMIVYFFGLDLAYIFTPEEEVALCAQEFLRATSLECFLLAFSNTFNGYFSGVGRTNFVMVNSLLSAFLIRIPLALYFGYKAEPHLFEIGTAAVYAALGCLVLCVIYYIYLERKESSSL